MSHSLRNPVVMSRASSALDSSYDSPWSNGTRKIILACSELSGAPVWFNISWQHSWWFIRTKLDSNLRVVVLWGDSLSSGAPGIIKQMERRITLAYLTVYSIRTDPSTWNEGLITDTLSLTLMCSIITTHFVFCFFFCHNRSNFFGFSFTRYSMCLILFLFTCFPIPCRRSCTVSLPAHPPNPHVYICVCVSVSPLSGVLCSVFVCSSVWACERQTQSTLFTFCHKPHTARARRSHLKLICMLDQLFTNKLQMHVCQCIIRGWHVALSRRIGLTACYAIHSKHIFTDGICLISEFTCTDMRICTFTFQCRVTHRKHWLIYWYSHARLHYTHIQ